MITLYILVINCKTNSINNSVNYRIYQQPIEQQPIEQQLIEQPIEKPIKQQPIDRQPIEQQPIDRTNYHQYLFPSELLLVCKTKGHQNLKIMTKLFFN